MKPELPDLPVPVRRRAMGGGARPPWASRVLLGALAAAAFLHPGRTIADRPCLAEEPAHYRMTEFRAETPCTLAGATVLSTGALRRLVEQGAPVLVDVLPSPRRPAGLADGDLWAPLPHDSIPGSAWLPNTGFGALPVEEEAYLRDNLERLTGGDRARPVVFYCEARCWMSWNAARRAVAWGYAGVGWYPQGTDGWREAGLPLAAAVPVPREPGH